MTLHHHEIPRRPRARCIALGVTTAAAVVAWSARAAACPRCETALEARRVFAEDQPHLWALAIAVPFVLTTLVALWARGT